MSEKSFTRAKTGKVMTAFSEANKSWAASSLFRVASVLVPILAAGLVSYSGGSGGDHPNVLFISIDTTRQDHCSAFGYERATTPNLSKLCQQGTRFDLAYAPIATTAASHSTMFTGLYPIAHRVIKNGLTLNDNYVTLPELLSASGFQTAAVVSAFVLDGKFGLSQGFDDYHDAIPLEESTINWNSWEGHDVPGGFDRRADYTTSHAIKWLREKRNPERPFFLFAHYFDPHAPYDPPESFAQAFGVQEAPPESTEAAIRRYDAEIAFTDSEIGRLLEEVKKSGLAENTIVVVASDHGEGLNQHGWMFHGIHIYEEAVRVPLIFHWPDHITADRVIHEPVEFTDLTPTILDLVGVEMGDARFQGNSFAAVLRGKGNLDPDRAVFLHRRHYEGKFRGKHWAKGELFGIRRGAWKYIEGKEQNVKELFNLLDDPLERTNLVTKFPPIAQELALEIEKWRKTHRNANPIIDSMTEEDIKKLRALGYVR